MDNNVMEKVYVVIGLFVIASFAGSYFYGWYPIITCAIGLVLIAAILNAFNGGMGGRS